MYSREGDLECRSYLAANAGWIFGMVSMIIALLAWPYPRN